MNSYATAKTAIQPARKIRKAKLMKQTWKQRFRNWLMENDIDADVPQTIESDRLSSDGIRFQVYRASGGFVIECRQYDRIKDRPINSIHIVTDDEDLGNKIGQIITMESLRS